MLIFHVISGFENGGVEALIGRWATAMPQDIALHIIAHEAPVPACLERIRALGITVHLIPCRKRIGAHERAIRRLLRQYRPHAVHVHTTEWGFLALRAAKKSGVPVRIQHSHAAQRPSGLFSRVLLSLQFALGRRYSTHFVACGEAAGLCAFGKRAVEAGAVIKIPNGVSVSSYSFSAAEREALRIALGIDPRTVVLGMVARFSPQKNHEAALALFAHYRKKHPDAVLLLVGDGKGRARIEALAAAQFPEGAVRFLGVREDMRAVYSAMDRFLLPSRFEGFPITLVEAQCCGLPSVVSDTVARETALTDLVRFCAVDRPEEWCAALEAPPLAPRESYGRAVEEAGYSFDGIVERLLALYHTEK